MAVAGNTGGAGGAKNIARAQGRPKRARAKRSTPPPSSKPPRYQPTKGSADHGETPSSPVKVAVRVGHGPLGKRTYTSEQHTVANVPQAEAYLRRVKHARDTRERLRHEAGQDRKATRGFDRGTDAKGNVVWKAKALDAGRPGRDESSIVKEVRDSTRVQRVLDEADIEHAGVARGAPEFGTPKRQFARAIVKEGRKVDKSIVDRADAPDRPNIAGELVKAKQGNYLHADFRGSLARDAERSHRRREAEKGPKESDVLANVKHDFTDTLTSVVPAAVGVGTAAYEQVRRGADVVHQGVRRPGPAGRTHPRRQPASKALAEGAMHGVVGELAQGHVRKATHQAIIHPVGTALTAAGVAGVTLRGAQYGADVARALKAGERGSGVGKAVRAARGARAARPNLRVDVKRSKGSVRKLKVERKAARKPGGLRTGAIATRSQTYSHNPAIRAAQKAVERSRAASGKDPFSATGRRAKRIVKAKAKRAVDRTQAAGHVRAAEASHGIDDELAGLRGVEGIKARKKVRKTERKALRKRQGQSKDMRRHLFMLAQSGVVDTTTSQRISQTLAEHAQAHRKSLAEDKHDPASAAATEENLERVEAIKRLHDDGQNPFDEHLLSAAVQRRKVSGGQTRRRVPRMEGGEARAQGRLDKFIRLGREPVPRAKVHGPEPRPKAEAEAPAPVEGTPTPPEPPATPEGRVRDAEPPAAPGQDETPSAPDEGRITAHRLAAEKIDERVAEFADKRKGAEARLAGLDERVKAEQAKVTTKRARAQIHAQYASQRNKILGELAEAQEAERTARRAKATHRKNAPPGYTHVRARQRPTGGFRDPAAPVEKGPGPKEPGRTPTPRGEAAPEGAPAPRSHAEHRERLRGAYADLNELIAAQKAQIKAAAKKGKPTAGMKKKLARYERQQAYFLKHGRELRERMDAGETHSEFGSRATEEIGDEVTFKHSTEKLQNEIDKIAETLAKDRTKLPEDPANVPRDPETGDPLREPFKGSIEDTRVKKVKDAQGPRREEIIEAAEDSARAQTFAVARAVRRNELEIRVKQTYLAHRRAQLHDAGAKERVGSGRRAVRAKDETELTQARRRRAQLNEEERQHGVREQLEKDLKKAHDQSRMATKGYMDNMGGDPWPAFNARWREKFGEDAPFTVEQMDPTGPVQRPEGGPREGAFALGGGKFDAVENEINRLIKLGEDTEEWQTNPGIAEKIRMLEDFKKHFEVKGKRGRGPIQEQGYYERQRRRRKASQYGADAVVKIQGQLDDLADIRPLAEIKADRAGLDARIAELEGQAPAPSVRQMPMAEVQANRLAKEIADERAGTAMHGDRPAPMSEMEAQLSDLRRRDQEGGTATAPPVVREQGPSEAASEPPTGDPGPSEPSTERGSTPDASQGAERTREPPAPEPTPAPEPPPPSPQESERGYVPVERELPGEADPLLGATQIDGLLTRKSMMSQDWGGYDPAAVQTRLERGINSDAVRREVLANAYADKHDFDLASATKKAEQLSRDSPIKWSAVETRNPVADGPDTYAVLPKVFADRWKAAGREKRLPGKIIDALNVRFVRAVLPLSVMWHAGNAVDMMTRLALSGAKPGDADLAAQLRKAVGDVDPDWAREVVDSIGGAHFRGQSMRNTQNIAHHIPIIDTGLDHIFKLASDVEGKAARSAQGTALRQQAKAIGESARDAQAMVEHWRQRPELVDDFQRRTLEILGDYVHHPLLGSHDARVPMPFVQWLKASLKFTLLTLPVKHPLRTAIMFNLAAATEKQRREVGASRYISEADAKALGLPAPNTGFLAGGVDVGGGAIFPTSGLTSMSAVAGLFDDPREYAGRIAFPMLDRPLGRLAGSRDSLSEYALRSATEGKLTPGSGRDTGAPLSRRAAAEAGSGVLDSFLPGFHQAGVAARGGRRPGVHTTSVTSLAHRSQKDSAGKYRDSSTGKTYNPVRAALGLNPQKPFPIPESKRPVQTAGHGRYVKVTALDGSTHFFDTATHTIVPKAKAKALKTSVTGG